MNAPARIDGGRPMRSAEINETTRSAQEDTLLAPRFYTTDFDKLDKVDVSAIRPQWDALIAELKSDPNRGHFKRDENWDKIDLDALPEGLSQFLQSSFSKALARHGPPPPANDAAASLAGPGEGARGPPGPAPSSAGVETPRRRSASRRIYSRSPRR